MENFEMKDVISHGLLNIKSVLRVNWEITSHCNYKCSYCFGNAGMNNPQFNSFEELKKIANKIFDIKRDYYNILLIGGEPTVHPNFLDLLKYFNELDKKISLNIVSNGSKSIEYHKKLFESIKDKELLFNISVHLEQCRLEHIANIIILANEYNVYLILSFMLHPEKEDLLEQFLLEFIELRKSFYFDIMFMELRQAPLFDRNDERYTDRHYQWIDNAKARWKEAVENSKAKKINFLSGVPINGYNIIKDGKIINNLELDYAISIRNGLKSFSGFYCFGGSNFIYIHPDGTYSGSIQCPKFANMGSLLNDNLNFKFEICDQYQCGCNSNDVIPKFR
ncbi:radical SAM protein, partial [Brachyspira catarrhinii]